MVKKTRRWNKITTIHHFKNLETVRVFGIARVSTDKQAKYGESLEHQREVISNWVRSKASINAPQGWKMVDLFIENDDKDGVKRGRTATKREGRHGLSKALELAKARLVDVVVVTKLDRIARNVKDYIDISAEFNESEVALVCLDLDIDTSTPDGQMIMRNHANLAQWQAERIAQYSVETVRRHAKQGRPLGSPPLGYRVVHQADGKHTLIPDPVYQKHIEVIDKLYLTSQSLDRVVRELHSKGYKSPKGKTYSKPQVSRILQNIRYTGRQEYDGAVYDGNWPSLRSSATQSMIEKIFNRNRKHRRSISRPMRYAYLLQGLLKCPHCHSSMTPKSGTGRKGKNYPYYLCGKADKTEGIDCEEIYLPAETIDNAVIDYLKGLRLKPGVIEKVIGKANDSTSSRIGHIQKDLERVREKLKDVRTKISNLVDVLADKGVSQLKAIKGKLETLDEEEKELALEEKRLDQETKAEKAQASAAHQQIQSLNLFSDLFRLNKDRPEKIKMILPRFVNFVVCHMTDKQKGIGRLDVGLFGKPFVGDGNAEIWNEALQELAVQCQKESSKDSIASGPVNPLLTRGLLVRPGGTTGVPCAIPGEPEKITKFLVRPGVINGAVDGN